MAVTEQRKKWLLEYQKNWSAKRRSDYFHDKTCVKCGSSEDLELDHIDPKLKVTHRIFSLCKEKQESELIKCQVLCSVCHKKKTKEYVTSPCGTIGKYENGCRCEPCKAKNRSRVQKGRHDRKSRSIDR